MSEQIDVGTTVLLWLDNRRKWLVEVKDGKQFHTHRGIIALTELVGKSFGDTVTTSTGYRLYVLRPSFYDRLSFLERPTQILYPKDIGFLLLRLDLGPGKIVVEAGTGSGAVTAAMANIVRPTGHVYSYDVNMSFLSKAESNLSKMDLLPHVTLRCSDARNGFEESNVDAVFLDLGDPWNVVAQAHLCLKGGANLASFSPTINQVEKTAICLRQHEFVDIDTCEIFLRHIRAEEGKSRPETRMIGHTGYLTFGRKANRTIEPSRDPASSLHP